MTVSAIAAAGERGPTIPRGALVWLVVLLFTGLCLAAQGNWPWLVNFPSGWTPPLAQWIDAVTDAVLPTVQPITRGFAAAVAWPMYGLKAAIQWSPWPATTAIIVLLAYLARGWRLAVFAAATCAYFLVSGYWRQTMNTLVLVLLAIPLSALPGFLIGAVTCSRPALRKATEACLDVMQTMPAFAYLIPLLLLFGFGPVVGLIASAIFAIPPMVRNTWVGLDLVPPAVKEAGIMAGCRPLQRFLFVETPSALPQLMVGLNQTTMAVLSMVIVATIIGGFEDIGWEVLNSARMAQLGHSLLSGLVIALLAILIDRATKGFAERTRVGHRVDRRSDLSAAAVAALVVVLALVVHAADAANPVLAFGRVGLIPAEPLDHALLALVRDHAAQITAIKNELFYYLLLPLRIGLVGSVIPQFWGFGLSPTFIAAYVAVLAAIGAGLMTVFGWRGAVAAVTVGLLLFYGLSGFPWPAFAALVVVLAWRIGGAPAGLFAGASLGFMLLAGMWAPMMLSIYLCGLAVLISVVIGAAIGFWAAANNRVSAIVRPISDALQTMPQFVFLIPAVMFFKVGDITALIAVVSYAVVPPIRYVEHGIRNVRPDVVEAARQMGCTPGQILWHVKVPLAMPIIMLGLNQTIMAALSMLAIAAMVGTRDLGQQVYIALGKADAGLGLIAGLSIALIAMTSDRILRAWVASHQTAVATR